MTAPIAVADSSIAPRTDSSASRFWGGTIADGAVGATVTGAVNLSRTGTARSSETDEIRARCRGKRTRVPYSIPRAGWLLPNGRTGYPPPVSRCEREVRRTLHRPCGALRAPAAPWREPPEPAASYAAGSASGSAASAAAGSASARSVGLDRVLDHDDIVDLADGVLLDLDHGGLVEHDCVVDELPFALVDGVGRRSCCCGGCRLGRLGGLHRGELFLGRQLATLGHDHQLDLGRDALEQVDRHRVAADPLDVVDADLAAVDADLADAPDLVGDVGRRDRAEERPGRAGLDVEPQDELAERLGDLVGLFGAARLVHRLLGVDALDLLHPSLRRDLGEVARQQEVAGVPAGDVDDLATQAELLHVFEQDHVHRYSPSSRRRAGARPRGPA